MPHTQIIIRFKDEEDAKKWFINARDNGSIQMSRVLARPDALSVNARRVTMHDLLVCDAESTIGEIVVGEF